MLETDEHLIARLQKKSMAIYMLLADLTPDEALDALATATAVAIISSLPPAGYDAGIDAFTVRLHRGLDPEHDEQCGGLH